MYKLRNYQTKAGDAIIKWLQDPKTINKAGVVVMPVASGKSVLIALAAHEAGGAVVLQPSVELLEQNVEKIETIYKINVSVFSHSAGRKDLGDLTYATLGSLKNFGKQLRDMGIKTLIIDEVDRQYPPEKWVTKEKVVKGVKKKGRELKDSMYTSFLKEFQPDRVIGFTATPFRIKTTMSCTSLHMINQIKPKVIDDIIYVEQVSTMIKDNFWANLSYLQYDFDEGLLKLNSSGADFTEESISEANKALNVNRNIYVKTIDLLRENVDNKILICAESIKIATQMADVLPTAGVITSETSKPERKLILKEFKEGKLRVLVNVATLLIGFDEPSLTHVIIGRPTGSFSLYYQIVGRVVRLHPKGLSAQVIDFCGNVKRFGMIEDLIIEKVRKLGWVATIGGFVLTGVTVGSRYTIEECQTRFKRGFKTCPLCFPFGKYKGHKIDTIPKYYLKWSISENCSYMDKFTVIKKAIEEYLED